MIIETYIPGNGMTDAGRAIEKMMEGVNEGSSYADMMRLRISGSVSDQCNDTYFVAREGEECLSRLWHGWGKHENAIGNFGNFLTREDLQGQGIGKQMMTVWQQTIEAEPNKPLGLFCSSKERPAQMYFRYGFRPALKGKSYGPLYLPLGDSPETFQEFCEMYYLPTKKLIARTATIQWRHEIDLLLKFALLDRGLKFGIGEYTVIEQALLYAPGKAEQIFTEEGRCVGWRIGDQTQLLPLYEGLNIVTEG